MAENEKKQLEFYTGKMSNLNLTEKNIQINPSNTFALKDLPSCIYRLAFFLTENQYASVRAFFEELTFNESLRLYQMVNLIIAEYNGAFKVSNSSEEYALVLARVTIMKCTELLCYAEGNTCLDADSVIQKMTVVGAMISAHFLTIAGTLQANYDNFSVDCVNIEQLVKKPPAEPIQET